MWFGSYGIGSTRAMGAWVEVSYDDKGIIWSKAISPYEAHLLELNNEKTVKRKNFTEGVYKKLENVGIEILWDDRDVSAGEKFADADLIGIPIRLVISDKTSDRLEWKLRKENKSEVISVEEAINRLKT